MDDEIERAIRHILAWDNLDKVFEAVEPLMMGTFVEETVLTMLAPIGIDESLMAFVREMSIVAATILLSMQKDYMEERLQRLGVDDGATTSRPAYEVVYDETGLFSVDSNGMTTNEVAKIALKSEPEILVRGFEHDDEVEW